VACHAVVPWMKVERRGCTTAVRVSASPTRSYPLDRGFHARGPGAVPGDRTHCCGASRARSAASGAATHAGEVLGGLAEVPAGAVHDDLHGAGEAVLRHEVLDLVEAGHLAAQLAIEEHQQVARGTRQARGRRGRVAA